MTPAASQANYENALVRPATAPGPEGTPSRLRLTQPHSHPSRDREKLRKNRLAGESACPTMTQALANQRGTDAFVCQHCDPGDFFSPSHGRGLGLESPGPMMGHHPSSCWEAVGGERTAAELVWQTQARTGESMRP